MSEENTQEAPQQETAPAPMLTLQLDLNEVNMILESLGKEQFNRVAGLINKVRSQGIAQLQPAPQQ